MKKFAKVLSVICLSAVSTVAHASDLFDNYNFDTAVAAHAAAAAMTDSRAVELVGTYKMIATASRSYRGDFQKKDLTGLKNQDQSVLGLEMNVPSPGGLLQVIQMNLGLAGQNQGPSVVAYTAAGVAAFTQFSYKDGQVSDAVFFNSECRLLKDQMLLCAKRFMVQDVTQVNANQAAMNNTIVGYDLYTR
jgi:hypothetical protein